MPSALYREIGRRIRRARENLGLSQEELARRLDYSSPATVSYFEAGARRISIADLQRIAGILGLPISYFLGEQSDAETQHFRLRAREVRPTARTGVAAFLSFARRHGGKAPHLLPGITALRPGHAAQRVLQAINIARPPVMPRDVAARLGVPVFDWDFPDEISGIYACDDGVVCIGVNEAHPYVRQRFTIAHELGHLIYAENRDLFLDFTEAEAAAWAEDSRHRLHEMKANQFAADLLMPRPWIRDDVRLRGLDVTFLAKRYEVSEQAVWFRLLALGLVQDSSED
jgi:Zn-dependent peptidase ImmA (M78 family)/transcriptional regulator with XRE-family HTH domain